MSQDSYQKNLNSRLEWEIREFEKKRMEELKQKKSSSQNTDEDKLKN